MPARQRQRSLALREGPGRQLAAPRIPGDPRRVEVQPAGPPPRSAFETTLVGRRRLADEVALGSAHPEVRAGAAIAPGFPRPSQITSAPCRGAIATIASTIAIAFAESNMCRAKAWSIFTNSKPSRCRWVRLGIAGAEVVEREADAALAAMAHHPATARSRACGFGDLELDAPGGRPWRSTRSTICRAMPGSTSCCAERFDRDVGSGSSRPASRNDDSSAITRSRTYSPTGTISEVSRPSLMNSTGETVPLPTIPTNAH